MASRATYRGSNRGPSKRVVLNRKTLTALGEGIADGYGQFGQNVIDRTEPGVPDAPPYGQGLVKTGAWAVYANGRKVGGQATAPRGRTTRPPKEGIALYVGYSFPGRFLELGTINHAARPFLTPVLNAELPRLPAVVREKTTARLRGVR